MCARSIMALHTGSRDGTKGAPVTKATVRKKINKAKHRFRIKKIAVSIAAV